MTPTQRAAIELAIADLEHISAALAETEPRNHVGARDAYAAGMGDPVYVTAPVQEPAKKLWLQHGVFPDVADFDADGLPRFYSKESADKFQSGQCSKPCTGKNCGSMNGWMHSIECRAEHEAVCCGAACRTSLTFV